MQRQKALTCATCCHADAAATAVQDVLIPPQFQILGKVTEVKLLAAHSRFGIFT